MKRFLSALAFCSIGLVALSFYLFKTAEAKDDVLIVLLELPSPAPPNPLSSRIGARDKSFYDKLKPPGDDAPIDELLDYWGMMAASYADLAYNPAPSQKTLARLMDEIERDNSKLVTFLNILPDGERTANFIKGIEGREDNNSDKDTRSTIRNWLKYHTPLYSDELAEIARTTADTAEYVSTTQTDLLALTRVDFDKAQPILNSLYDEPGNRSSKILATWALYRRALDTDSVGDTDRYRDELKAVVEDKKALPGMRDLALDALSKEKEWSGRDEWYFSLLSDETLADLRVNGSSFTGLTTLIQHAPDGKYTEKMLELLKSDNPVVRANAVRNLLVKFDAANIDVVRAMVPWLEDPKWATDVAGSRLTIVGKLAEYGIPESVPGLITVLNEEVRSPAHSNTAVNAVVANRAYSDGPFSGVMNKMVNGVPVSSNTRFRPPGDNDVLLVTTYPYRSSAISALAKQKDTRAVPALKRVLPSVEYYEQSGVVRAIIASKGYTIQEQVDGIELWAQRSVAEESGQPQEDPLANLYRFANTNANSVQLNRRAPTAFELRAMIGRELMNTAEASEDLARGAVARIEQLDKTDKTLAAVMRRTVLKWPNAAVNLMLLSDLKRGTVDSESIIRLLAERKNLAEKQPTDISDIKTGGPLAVGIAPCLLGDTHDAENILDNGDAETKIALLACARLIRLALPIDKVAAQFSTQTPLLATAAERYLEVEDSPPARSIVLSRHPGKAKVLGARTAFYVDGKETTSEMLYSLFLSLGDPSLYNGWGGSSNDDELTKIERAVVDEIKKDEQLLAVYTYDKNYVRIYKDRVMFAWDEDDSRYRERPLEKYEFDDIKALIVENKLDESPPFLTCGGAYCEAKEMIMAGRNGGRRVYMNGETPRVFAQLEKLFEGFRKAPSTLKYGLSREVPGLEIIIASDDLHAETVWKQGDDLRMAASLSAVRKRVDSDLAALDEETPGDGEYAEVQAKKEKLHQKREYEGFGWYRVTSEGATPNAGQPPGIEFIPIRDGLAVPSRNEQWKTRATGIELRSSDDGLFKVVGGRLVKVRSGKYENPLVTPNGRWAIVTKYDSEYSTQLVRIDLANNREYPIELEEQSFLYPSVFVATINRVLISFRSPSYGEYEYYSETEEDAVPDDSDPDTMKLIDPATGSVQPVAGEFRPLDQQTFRPLQSTGKTDEYWAAMPDREKERTVVGIYETRTFGFTPLMTVPKIRFNSMSMWVDEPGKKVYFVYRGHLLVLPLKR